jgi:hypothetical protein
MVLIIESFKLLKFQCSIGALKQVVSSLSFQIIEKYPNSHVLATAPSNAATDHLALKLLKMIPSSQILRFYSASRDESLVPLDLKFISNFMREVNTLEILSSYRY